MIASEVPAEPADMPAPTPGSTPGSTPESRPATGPGCAPVRRQATRATGAAAPAVRSQPTRTRTARVTRSGAGGPRTLAIDIGGTGLKATVLDPKGKELVPRVRVDTHYPLPPEEMVHALAELVAPLPARDRASVGFPGVVRGGLVLTAPHFVTAKGPGTRVVPKLVKAWDRFPLAKHIEAAVGVPVRLANDADLQGSAVVTGKGLELVLTLGTGLGSALFQDGRLCCHLELAHHPFQKDQSYNDRIGDAARKRLGTRKWNRRVAEALATIDALLVPDRIYVGGGNAVHVRDPGPKVTIVSNEAGLLGGITLWSAPVP